MLREIARGDLYILYPKGEGLPEVARLAFRPYTPQKDIARHYDIVRETFCEYVGCKQALQTNKPHGWTCADHDPLATKKRS